MKPGSHGHLPYFVSQFGKWFKMPSRAVGEVESYKDDDERNKIGDSKAKKRQLPNRGCYVALHSRSEKHGDQQFRSQSPSR